MPRATKKKITAPALRPRTSGPAQQFHRRGALLTPEQWVHVDTLAQSETVRRKTKFTASAALRMIVEKARLAAGG